MELDCPPELRQAAETAVRAAGLSDCHLAVELVDEHRIQELNRRFRGRDSPTDVLAFPVDGSEPAPGPRELGDVVVCPERAEDVEEAVVHGILHLAGHDHESDRGEMLALQDAVMRELRGAGS